LLLRFRCVVPLACASGLSDDADIELQVSLFHNTSKHITTQPESTTRNNNNQHSNNFSPGTVADINVLVAFFTAVKPRAQVQITVLAFVYFKCDFMRTAFV
jgi:hypothetical protein